MKKKPKKQAPFTAVQLLGRIAAIEAKLRTRRGAFVVKPLVTTPKLSAAQGAALEKRIAHPLPPLLHALYTTVGATLAFRWRFAKGKAESFGAKGEWGGEPWGALLIDRPELDETSDGTTYVRFGDNGNGRRFALDYGAKKGPSVVDYDHETIDDASEVSDGIAPFLEALAARGFMHVEDDTEMLDAFFAGD